MEGATLGIYKLGAELGRGGMGTVHRAESTAEGPAGPAGSTVALKIFHPELVADERSFARFKLEAEIGKEILHEHLVRTYGIGNAQLEGNTYHFMVMEVIEGQTLKGLLAELGTFPEHLLYQVADQALDALHEIHERGVVHRDIKPENIVITPDHKVLLMDLGVARRETGYEMTQAGEFIGSLVYAPPEQFQAVDVDRRADIYAFGVTLFELATGRSPFGTKDLSALIGDKLQGETPAPKDVYEELDPFWDQVIHTCMQREKADRFKSADVLRQILREGESSDWWRNKVAGHTVPSAEHALKRLRLERATPLVGRAEALAFLQAREGAVLLAGPGGVGKSRLLFDYLESVAGADGPAIGAGRAVGAGGVGYGPFIEALGDLVAGDPERLLPDTPGVVAPFAEFLQGNLQPGPDSDLSKDALFAAAVKVLRGLAAERPVIVAVEDLHLAGAETVELFQHIARNAAGHKILLVGVYASDEVDDDAQLNQLPAERHVLPPLSDTDTETLVRHVVRHERAVRALSPELFAKSEGRPLIVLEVLRHLQEKDQLVEADGGLELAADLDQIALPSSVHDLVSLQLAALDEEQRETLEAAAILGVDFEASLLAEVLEEKPIELLQRLAVLEKKHRLLASAGKDTFRFASRQLFEAVYESVTPALRIEYHELVADTLLEDDDEPEGARAYMLLNHLFLAERALEAAPFLDSAIDFMAKNFHASFAAPLLESVGEAFAAAPPAPRFAIAMKLWTFYELLASREDQLRVLETGQAVAEELDDAGKRGRVHALRAGTYWYSGDYDRMREEAEKGLALAREAGDRKWEGTCHHTLGAVFYRRGERDAAAGEFRRALEIRRDIGDRRGEASTLQALGAVTPAADEALAVFEESLKVWREIGERRGEAMMLMNLGNRYVDAARYDDGLSHLQQAIEGHRETGALFHEALSLTNLGRAEDILGRIDDARVSWKRALDLFKDLENPHGELSARVMCGLALGTYGEHDEAREHLEAAVTLAERTGATARLVSAHYGLGLLFHDMGDRKRSWAHLDTALALESVYKDAVEQVLTLAAAAKVALAEEDFERATGYLVAALPDARSGDVHLMLVLSRLARAHHGAGRADEARECAREVRELVAESVPTDDGPEIFFTLYQIEGDAAFLARAREIVEERARRIRNDSYRDYFRTRTWPNSAILKEEGPAAGATDP